MYSEYRNYGVHELLDTLCDLARSLDMSLQDHIGSQEYENSRREYKLCKNEVERRLRKLQDIEDSMDNLKECLQKYE